MSKVDISVLFSALLALAWQRGQSGAKDETKELQLDGALWAPIMALRHSNQVLPSILVLYAASSFSAAVYAGFTLGLHLEEGWLGSELSSNRSLAVHAAVCIWRAEKVEILLQRMQRSVTIVQNHGLGSSLKNSFSEPFTWFWPGFWGSARRLALLVVSSVGYGSFVRVVLPAVVFDECLWWLTTKTQDLFTRKVCALPMVLDLVVLPFLDFLHLVPVMTKVALMALLVYSDHDQCPILLVISALAWTGHNCHLTKTTLLEDLPDQLWQLWQSRAS
ncbi:unnamed protein product [Durusdinium trenchii]|uniref:Uncharacterized protein n=1 Tax=Durusdinium trenchii TaxID=1381693 RepID=A0ABP0P7W1_9DINO